MRASLSIAKRLVKRILPKRGKTASGSWPWVIISDKADDVAQRAGITDYTDNLPASGNYNVLIDNGCHTCAQVVDYIYQHSDKSRLAFHIFADRHGVIISPKMSQS